MKFKNALSLKFTFMFALLLSAVLTGIYLFVEHNRSVSFYNKLDERAMIAAQFYFAEDNLSIKMFSQVAKKFPQSLSSESISIYDQQLEPKFMPEDSIRWKHSFLKEIVKKKNLHFLSGQRQVAGLYYEDNSGNFIVVVSALDEQGFHDMRQLRLIMSVFFVASLFITFFIGRIFANLSLQPIVGMTAGLKRIRASNLHMRLPVRTRKTDEIDNLSLTINQLLEHLEQSFEGQKSFVANASHELRTPITAILGEAEITLMKERTAVEYQKALQEVVAGVEQLNHIINSLMELLQTNLDNKDFQNIRIDELMWEVADELSLKKRTEQVHYTIPEEVSGIELLGNRRLLFIAISNLLKNAVKFSEGKMVNCTVSYDARGLYIEIRDQGIGIAAQDLDRIFQPFYRSSNALEYPGYGIGLSLTYNIVKLHNGRIEINSELRKGTTVKLFLPAV
ncbi:sensor histidine kinase [Pedobacter nutrimenti]|uniref:histidine kinase n=1 Tax=Pedobacter nutrimenti TaxID=1241337 RepID=A0A318U988_9SPHI|nr:HAMP domain-containing sensor histidine kinase [Pedobacter nutrimenti]PYF71496.1 signal transduction histidine kinase [Pedobacter nutrimenti]